MEHTCENCNFYNPSVYDYDELGICLERRFMECQVAGEYDYFMNKEVIEDV